MRKLNKRIVYDLIRKNRAVTRPDISAVTGLKPPTVKSVIESLLEDGLIVRAGKGGGSQGGGPRPDTYSVNSGKCYFIGLDVSVIGIAATLIDLCGNVAAEYYAPFSNDGTEPLAAALRGAVGSLLESSSRALGEVSEISVSFASMVDADKKKITATSYEQISRFCAEELRAALGCAEGVKIVLENDVNAVAMGTVCLAEELKGERNVLCVGVRNGVGFSVIADGRLCRGNGGLVGCAGVAPEIFGEERIIKHINELAAAGKISGVSRPIASRAEFYELLVENVEIKNVAACCLERLGRYVADFVSLLDPGAVILAGQLMDVCPELFETVVNGCEKRLSEIFAGVLCARSAPVYYHSKLGRYGVAYFSAVCAMTEYYSLFDMTVCVI